MRCICLCALFAITGFAQPQLSLYGNFHTMGITVELLPGDDPDQDASADLRIRTVPGSFADGFPLTRVSLTRFVGSAFNLEPGQLYEVEISLTDPDFGPIDGVVVMQQQATRAEFAMPAFSRRLVVHPTGSGTTCSDAIPCSLSEALSQVGPGDEIVLQDGVYYEGDFNLPISGTSAMPIAIRADTGTAPVMDGSYNQTFIWTAGAQGTYSTQVSEPDPHLVTSNGERLYPYQNISDLQNQIWGLAGFTASGTTVTVKLDGGINPNTTNMVIARHNSAFHVGRDYWIFDGITFRHYGGGSFAKAIYIDDGSFTTIQNCSFQINDSGIGIKRASHQNLIQDNEFFDTVFMWPWDAVKAGSQLETGGVVVYDPMTGRGNVIRRNVFHDYFDGLQSCPGNDNGPLTNEMDIYENEVYRAGDDGLSADGVCSNVRIWRNRFHDVLVGISLAPILEGPVYALRNEVSRTGAGNSIYTGYPFKFNVGSQPTSGMMYLFHNTSDAIYPGNHGFDIKSPGTWQGIVSRNNIWVGTDYGLRDANTSQPLDMDYDLIWNDGLNHLVRWGAVNYTTLLDFQSGTGQNTQGIESDPMFVDRMNGNLTLSTSSNAIDQGLIIPGINDGFSGLAPDLGAHEWSELQTPYDAWRLTSQDPGYQSAYDHNGDQIIDIRDFI
ncbi:MAG: right-handed parallel beta-helix repeat-containing protein [Acidobacteria bacterium]|nr:right-handed parallel beta-helix repeat-containing protein [Acidobacteriota bacterium]